jgi:hypothetical protein
MISIGEIPLSHRGLRDAVIVCRIQRKREGWRKCSLRQDFLQSLYLQVGASAHRAESTISSLNAIVDIFEDRPANSPNLNPIQNLWATLKPR